MDEYLARLARSQAEAVERLHVPGDEREVAEDDEEEERR